MNVVIQLFLYDLSTCKSEYEESRKRLRIWEYSTVLMKNCQDTQIQRIHVLCESEEALKYYRDLTYEYCEKMTFVLVGHQPTYKEIVQYVKQTIPPNEIVCIMNADMFFNSAKDHTLIQKHLKQNHLFALTRHEITNEGHTIHGEESCPFTVHGGSCDTFVFRTPLSENLDLSKMDFRQNLFGAEGVFMKIWVDAGYTLLNPCDHIITLHLHRDRVHFEQYKTIDTPENSVLNLKTPLPPL